MARLRTGPVEMEYPQVMCDDTDRPDSDTSSSGEQTPFERFHALTQRLLHVPKHEVDEAVERDREKRRTA